MKYEIPLETFYRLNPKLMLRYQPFLLASMEHRHMRTSEVGWAHGLYTLRAISSSRNKRYPDEPLKIWGGSSVNEEGEPMTDADRFGAWAMAFNAGFKNKQAEPTQ